MGTFKVQLAGTFAKDWRSKPSLRPPEALTSLEMLSSMPPRGGLLPFTHLYVLPMVELWASQGTCICHVRPSWVP